MRHVELAGASARLPPLADEPATRVELDHARVAIPIADIHRAVEALRHIGGTIEVTPVGARHTLLPKREELAAFGVELEHLMECHVSQPDVPLMIHTETVWHGEPTRPPGSHQLTCLRTEAEHRRLSDRLGAQRAGAPTAARPAE